MYLKQLFLKKQLEELEKGIEECEARLEEKV